MMLAMCLERLISVVEPLWYTTTWLEENYSLYLILFMGLLGTLPSVLPLMIGSVAYHHSRKCLGKGFPWEDSYRSNGVLKK